MNISSVNFMTDRNKSMAGFIRSCILAAVCTAVAAVSAPDCQIIAPEQKLLNVHTANLNLSGNPFGLLYARKDIAFAAVAKANVVVLNTSTFTPTLIREIALLEPSSLELFSFGGLAITQDKKVISFLLFLTPRSS
jgi:hypothetical protein